MNTFLCLVWGHLVEGDEGVGVAVGGEVLGEQNFDEFGDGAIEDSLVDLGGVVPGLEGGFEVGVSPLELLWDDVELIGLHKLYYSVE